LDKQISALQADMKALTAKNEGLNKKINDLEAEKRDNEN